MTKKLKMIAILICAILVPSTFLLVGCNKNTNNNEQPTEQTTPVVPEAVVSNLSIEKADYVYLLNENSSTDLATRLENKESKTYDVYLKNNYDLDSLKILVGGSEVSWTKNSTLPDADEVNLNFSKVGKVTLGNYSEDKAVTFSANQKLINVKLSWWQDDPEKQDQNNLTASEKNTLMNFQFVNFGETGSVSVAGKINGTGIFSFTYEQFTNLHASLYIRDNQKVGYYGSGTNSGLNLFEDKDACSYDLSKNYFVYQVTPVAETYKTNYELVVNPRLLARPTSYKIENESSSIITLGSTTIATTELEDSSTDEFSVQFTFNLPTDADLDGVTIYCYDTQIDDAKISKAQNVWTISMDKSKLPIDYFDTTLAESETAVDYTGFDALTYKFRVENIKFGDTVSKVEFSVIGQGPSSITQNLNKQGSKHFYIDGNVAYIDGTTDGNYFLFSYTTSNLNRSTKLIIHDREIEGSRSEFLLSNKLSEFQAVEGENGKYSLTVSGIEITVDVGSAELDVANITEITFKTPVASSSAIYDYAIVVCNY